MVLSRFLECLPVGTFFKMEEIMSDKLYNTIYLGRKPEVPVLHVSRLHAALFVGALAMIGFLLASNSHPEAQPE